VINRSDLGDNNVREYAHQKDLSILMEIPFSREIATAYSRGEMLIDVLPEWKDKFLGLYGQIKHLAKH
jgi:MinD superfamily P-loop ATPase